MTHVESTTWRVTSTRGDFNHDAGYWTSSYTSRADALTHAEDMRKSPVGTGIVRCYEVTDIWKYDANTGKSGDHISETWKAIK